MTVCDVAKEAKKKSRKEMELQPQTVF